MNFEIVLTAGTDDSGILFLLFCIGLSNMF